jgi:hypothetical protein
MTIAFRISLLTLSTLLLLTVLATLSSAAQPVREAAPVVEAR